MCEVIWCIDIVLKLCLMNRFLVVLRMCVFVLLVCCVLDDCVLDGCFVDGCFF